jgi:N-acetylglutamate synthase-like GNAT family acetyltransferase
VAFEIDDHSSAFCTNTLKSLFHDVRFKHYFVEDQGKIVGVGSLFTENGVSGFYNLGVLPEYRHQKIATALKCFRLKESQRSGSKFAILQSSTQGKELDQSVGFKPVFDFVPYFSPVDF